MSPLALRSVSLRVHQLIKETSAPIKGPIKKQGGEAHLDGNTSLRFLRQQNSELDNETQRLSQQHG